jgi:hypothetical protein
LVSRAVVSDAPAHDLTKIPIETTALVESPLSLDGLPPGNAALIEDRPGRVRIVAAVPSLKARDVGEGKRPIDPRLRVGLPGTRHEADGTRSVPATLTGQLLCISESFHPGWQAMVDGCPAPVVRVNGDFLGCVVGPGRHEVTLEFRPKSLWYGALLSLAGLSFLALLPVIRLRLARPRSGIRENSTPVGIERGILTNSATESANAEAGSFGPGDPASLVTGA